MSAPAPRSITSMVAAAVVGLATATASVPAATAQAVATYTPAGGPSVALVGANVVITDVDASASFTCTSVGLAGTVLSPSANRDFGAAAAGLSSAVATGCTNPIFGATTLRLDQAAELTVTGPAMDGAYPITVAPVDIELIMGGCSLGIAGPLTGSVDPSSGTVGLQGTNLVMTTVVGLTCFTLGFWPGDPITITGSWSLATPPGSSPLTISSP